MSIHPLCVLTAVLLGPATEPRVPGPDRPVALAAPARFDRHAVVSDSAIASRVGADILEAGGNAVDAAVATAMALAVVHPEAGNVGGGGFLVVRLPDGTSTCFDFRETAPLQARPDMFLGPEGKYDPEKHHEGALSVGVPGSVAGLHLAHSRLGRAPWAKLVDPAVKLARGGLVVSPALAESLREAGPRLSRYPASVAQFMREGKTLRTGDTLVQEDLARTLERVRDRGAAGFYKGETADLIVEEMRRLGGIIRHEDLARYAAVERKPVTGTYRGFEIISMPPPSSGGVALIEMLNVLEGYDLAELGLRGSRESHLLVEAMRRAFADRARHLGDPDGAEIPVSRLTSREHAASLQTTIDPLRASRSREDSFEWPAEGNQTTHLSVVDGDLMAVSLTTTLEQSYGSAIVVTGAGFLLNNEMGDFNAKPGLTTAGGLIGTEPNLAAPGKRMLSSMTPTIVARGGWPVLVVGSPGGRTIINTVLQVVVNCLDHHLNIQEAIDQPRFHHQWLPDRILAEPRCFAPDVRAALDAMGHRIEDATSPQGSAMGIFVLRDVGPGSHHLEAGVDRRRRDGGAAGK